jgi:hypothetical protein
MGTDTKAQANPINAFEIVIAARNTAEENGLAPFR